MIARARQVTPDMIRTAADAVAGLVDTVTPGASVLPDVSSLRAVSATVAVAVVRQAVAEGVARAQHEDVVQAVQDAMWLPDYPEMVAS